MEQYDIEDFWQRTFLAAFAKPGATVQSAKQDADLATEALKETFPLDNEPLGGD